MKKIIYLLICMLVVTSIANAQNDSTRHKKDKGISNNMDSTKKAKSKNKELVKSLDLSSNQKKSLDSIHTEAHKQRNAIENDKSLTDAQKQEKIKALKQQERSKMNAILTPEQREKAKQAKKENKGSSGGQ